MDFGFGNIPAPVIALIILMFFYYAMRKKKIRTLRKEDKRLGLEISVARKKQELKALQDKEKAGKKSNWR